jgi:hypothetical protein
VQAAVTLGIHVQVVCMLQTPTAKGATQAGIPEPSIQQHNQKSIHEWSQPGTYTLLTTASLSCPQARPTLLPPGLSTKQGTTKQHMLLVVSTMCQQHPKLRV